MLDEDNPALVGAIGIDPGVKNLVPSSTGVKVTRQDYYGTCRHKKRIKKDKKTRRRKLVASGLTPSEV
jgi:transposase